MCFFQKRSHSLALTRRGQWTASDFLLEFSRTAKLLQNKELGDRLSGNHLGNAIIGGNWVAYMSAPPAANTARFGDFVVDLRSGELRKNGIKIRVQVQPFQVLALLLQRPGEMVTREELRENLWPENTFVDFDDGLNTAVRKLRQLLRDSPEHPKYIETLPRRGYRLICPVELQPSHIAQGAPAEPQAAPAGQVPPRMAHPSRRRAIWIGVFLTATAVAGLLAVNPNEWRYRVMGTPRKGAIRSLAVLPLENLSGDPDQEYFADGMTDELITDLSRAVNARVVSRTSIMRYKKNTKPLAQVGRELNVDALIEGTVERSEDRVRIRVQLIQTSTDQLLWARSYDHELRDTLLLQSDVARDIVREIHSSLAASEQTRLASARQVDPDVYESYLKGLYFSNKRSAAEFPRAIKYFQQAIAKDPSYAAAYAGLTEALVGEIYTGTPPDDVREKATWAALKAIELDPSLPEGHFELGVVREVYDWDWFGAEKEYLRAIDLNQNLAAAHQEYAVFLAAQGRFDQAVAEAQRSQDLDPLSPFVRTTYCLDLYVSRRYDQAIQKCQQALELDPGFLHAHGNLVGIYEAAGMYDRAFDQYQKVALITGETSARSADLKKAFRRAGIRGIWLKQLELSQKATGPVPDAVGIAALYSRLGETNHAFAWLQRAYQAHSPFIENLKEDPSFDNVRSDPRFGELLHRANLLQ
jgi:TolB-like protein/DNA-binding winged helix-turn-helix (wHTH) protein